jgi:chitinase
VQVDKELIASWVYDPEKQTLISFDNPEVAKLKAKYIVEEGLGGAMWWQVSMDRPSGSGESLVDSVLETFGSMQGRS